MPDVNAIPGTLSAAEVGLLTNKTLGANISVVNCDYRRRYVSEYYATSCATTQNKLIGLSLFDFALLLIDLDGFKPINDAHGHAVGDEVLCEVARRLTDLALGADRVARIGGDEFVLLLRGETLCERNQWLPEFAARIMHSLEAPYAVGNSRLQLSASIGVAQCIPVVPNAVALIRMADMAMYEAKMAGDARVHFAQSQVMGK